MHDCACFAASDALNPLVFPHIGHDLWVSFVACRPGELSAKSGGVYLLSASARPIVADAARGPERSRSSPVKPACKGAIIACCVSWGVAGVHRRESSRFPPSLGEARLASVADLADAGAAPGPTGVVAIARARLGTRRLSLARPRLPRQRAVSAKSSGVDRESGARGARRRTDGAGVLRSVAGVLAGGF